MAALSFRDHSHDGLKAHVYIGQAGYHPVCQAQSAQQGRRTGSIPDAAAGYISVQKPKFCALPMQSRAAQALRIQRVL